VATAPVDPPRDAGLGTGAVGGQLVDDLEGPRGALRGIDGHRHHRNVTPHLKESISMRGVISVEPPDAAQACRTGGLRLAQATDDLQVQRPTFVVGVLRAVEGELLPYRHAVFVDARKGAPQFDILRWAERGYSATRGDATQTGGAVRCLFRAASRRVQGARWTPYGHVTGEQSAPFACQEAPGRAAGPGGRPPAGKPMRFRIVAVGKIRES